MTSTKRTNSKGSQARSSINSLPEEILILIISLLPLNDAVKTSILSKQWKSLWLQVPTWHLELQKFPCRRHKETYFELLVSQVLGFQARPTILEHLRLHHDGYRLDAFLARTWMTNLSMQTISKLEIDLAVAIRPPPEFFRRASLEELTVRSLHAIFDMPQDARMPQLKRVSLDAVYFYGAISLQWFFGACPSLTHMELRNCAIMERQPMNIIICHHRLQVLVLENCLLFHGYGRLLLATKNLERLEYSGETFLSHNHSFVFLSSVKEATLELDQNHSDYMFLRMNGGALHYGINLCILLGSLSNASTLDLNEICIEYLSVIPTTIPLPLFGNLETLRLCIWPNKGHTHVVAHFMDYAPNLTYLRISIMEPMIFGITDEQREDLAEPPDFTRWKFTHESLQEVEILKCGVLSTAELLLVKYILRTAVALEQLDVLTCCSERHPDAGGVDMRDIIMSFPVANPDVEISFY